MQNSNEKSKECCKEFHEKDTKNINSFINEECDCHCHKPSVEVSKHICCDGECNHDDCCGKVDNPNCPKFEPSVTESDCRSDGGYTGIIGPLVIESTSYSHSSHTHCWENVRNAMPCGIPLEKHTQCCLCEKLPPNLTPESTECDCESKSDIAHYKGCKSLPKGLGESTEMEEWIEIGKQRISLTQLCQMKYPQHAIDGAIQKLVSELKEKIVKEIKIRVGGEAFTVNAVKAIDDIITTINNIK